MELTMPGGFLAKLYKKTGLLGDVKLPNDFDDFVEKFAWFRLPDLPEDTVKFIELNKFKDKKPIESMCFLPSESAVEIRIENYPIKTKLVLRISNGKVELQEVTFNQKEIKEKTLFKKSLKTILSGK